MVAYETTEAVDASDLSGPPRRTTPTGRRGGHARRGRVGPRAAECRGERGGAGRGRAPRRARRPGRVGAPRATRAAPCFDLCVVGLAYPAVVDAAWVPSAPAAAMRGGGGDDGRAAPTRWSWVTRGPTSRCASRARTGGAPSRRRPRTRSCSSATACCGTARRSCCPRTRPTRWRCAARCAWTCWRRPAAPPTPTRRSTRRPPRLPVVARAARARLRGGARARGRAAGGAPGQALVEERRAAPSRVAPRRGARRCATGGRRAGRGAARRAAPRVGRVPAAHGRGRPHAPEPPLARPAARAARVRAHAAHAAVGPGPARGRWEASAVSVHAIAAVRAMPLTRAQFAHVRARARSRRWSTCEHGLRTARTATTRRRRGREEPGRGRERRTLLAPCDATPETLTMLLASMLSCEAPLDDPGARPEEVRLPRDGTLSEAAAACDPHEAVCAYEVSCATTRSCCAATALPARAARARGGPAGGPARQDVAVECDEGAVDPARLARFFPTARRAERQDGGAVRVRARGAGARLCASGRSAGSTRAPTCRASARA